MDTSRVDVGTLRTEFEEKGYAIVRDFCTKEEIDEIRREMDRLISEWEPSESVSIFSAKDQKAKTDEYFLTSGDKIRFFYEEAAFSPEGKLIADKSRVINKVGHALHTLNPVFAKFSFQQKFIDLIKAVHEFSDPRLCQSMYIFKQPKIGGTVIPHQDSTFLYTDPPSAIALWFAFENATKTNGCLWGLPGSHKDGLYKRFVRGSEPNTITFTTIKEEPEWDLSKFECLECEAGSIVLLHGSVIHMSYANTSPQSRHAYTLHVIEGKDDYPKDNWLRVEGEFPKFVSKDK